MTTTKHPFDTDQMNKGDLVDAELIERGYGVKRNDPDYRWSLLRARKFVGNALKERGQIVTVLIVGDHLKICTDDEQYKPNIQAIMIGQRKMRRGHGRMIGADRSKMSADVLQLHDRAIEVTGRKLSAMRAVTSPSLPEPTQRITPGRRLKP